MFDDVPDWLTEKVKGLRKTIIDPSNREQVYYEAAGWTIAWYLRADVLSAEAGGFFDLPSEKGQVIPHAHVNRVILVAEVLFLLRSSPGFSELRQRLEKRGLRPSFFEMFAAKKFLEAGFQIEASAPIRVRGEDFDFLARRNKEIVNVEVTALEAAEFSEKTIINALRHKRKQLPDTAPAMICCVLPEEWLAAAINWDGVLSGIAAEFFAGKRGTRRINAVDFLMEHHVNSGPDTAGGMLVVVAKTYFNPSARHQIDLSFLETGVSSKSLREELGSGNNLQSWYDLSYDNEFFRWIDHLVPLPDEAK